MKSGNGKQHSLWFVRTRMKGLPQNVLLNFRLEFPKSYHLPSIRNFRNFLSNGKHPTCPFQNRSFTSGILNKSTVSAKFTCDDLCGESESYWERVMWWYFARIKCGNIVSGWLWIVLSVPRTWLIVWFPEVVDRQISACPISPTAREQALRSQMN